MGIEDRTAPVRARPLRGGVAKANVAHEDSWRGRALSIRARFDARARRFLEGMAALALEEQGVPMGDDIEVGSHPVSR
jgi:hypothetical protein